MRIRAFLLPLNQRDRLREAGGPLADPEVDLAGLEWEALPVVEVDGRIVAYWPAFFGLHLEPLWIDEGHRTAAGAGVARALLDLMELTVANIKRPVAFAVIAPDSPALPLSEKLGFARVPGDLYYVVLQLVQPPVDGV